MQFSRDEVISIVAATLVAASFFAVVRFDVPSLFSTLIARGSAEDVVVLNADGDPAPFYDALSASGDVQKLMVEDVTVGEGPAVTKGSRVAVHYVGKLADGTTFASTGELGDPYRFTVGMGDVIEGWDIGLLGMREGGERILIVPARLGYGSRSIGEVPPNSTLLFSIRLMSVE